MTPLPTMRAFKAKISLPWYMPITALLIYKCAQMPDLKITFAKNAGGDWPIGRMKAAKAYCSYIRLRIICSTIHQHSKLAESQYCYVPSFAWDVIIFKHLINSQKCSIVFDALIIMPTNHPDPDHLKVSSSLYISNCRISQKLLSLCCTV